MVRAHLATRAATDGVTQIHDLGCGTGSMARWLSGRLTGPQHWVLYDRDAELLSLVAASPPDRAADGAPVTCVTRQRDISRLEQVELAGASLVTASALLDMMTAEELGRLASSCAGTGCAVLIALSVTGEVELAPGHPLDRRVAAAFNAHQRRDIGGGPLLGPDAVGAARDAFILQGLEVVVRPSPWRLGPQQSALTGEWLTGWLAAAGEQDPELGAITSSYSAERLAQAAEGRLSVTVHHQDLLALPR